MPVYAQKQHEALIRLPAALRAAMAARRHTQEEVAAACGVLQSDVSRALSGRRKRLTGAMLQLCQYANIDPVSAHLPNAADAVRATVDRVLTQRPDAAPLLHAWLCALEPWLADSAQDLRRSPRKAR